MVFRWFPGFLALWERDLQVWKLAPPRFFPIKTGNKRLCPIRAFKPYLKSKPVKREADRTWPFRKITISYLVRDTIKDSVRVAHPSMPEAEIDGLKITVHGMHQSRPGVDWAGRFGHPKRQK